MEMRFTVLLAVGVFLGANGAIFAQPAGKDLRADPLDLTLFGKPAQAQKGKTLGVYSVSVRLAAGTKIARVSPVKTAEGMRVQLEITGATIIAERLRIEGVAEIEVSDDGAVIIHGRPLSDEELKKALQPSR